MKSLAIACALLVAGLAASASAADVSKSTLDAMGFGNATVMSDIDGMAVRGKGTSAEVWGRGTANFNNSYGSNTSTNGYEAEASHRYGRSEAGGSNLSNAGYEKHSSYIRDGYEVTRSTLKMNFAGGSSSAFAK